MDRAWAIEELKSFLQLAELYRPTDPPGMMIMSSNLSNRGSQADITKSAYAVEQIFDRVLPNWRVTVPSLDNKKVNVWCQHIEAAQRAQTALDRRSEIQEKLGNNAPQLNAANMHPWIWESARSLWQSGHYRDAVGSAFKKLNAELQNKINRRDISETDLFKQAFSDDSPQPNKPRLRVMPNDGSKTSTSLQRGIRNFAEGCYAALRNPLSHTEDDLLENEALEQLAALSILARWVDNSEKYIHTVS